ncbi:MAG TPA: site-2 protease family protein [Candidatus Udaeobacter sp.]|nr:site-2 protease family protein [Candidatus Udaeobacter sp.]
MSILATWLIFMLVFLAIGYMLGARSRGAAPRETGSSETPAIGAETLADFQQRVMPVLAVAGHQTRAGGVLFEGKLRTDPQSALSQLTHVFAADKLTPILEEGDQGGEVKIALIPGIDQLARPSAALERPKWGVHWLLFVLTLITTTWAGALHAGVDLIKEPGRFAVGLPYSLGLMLILGAHELGHYFAAKHHGIRVTPPYFIPVPFALGTFGAFIKLKSLAPDRRASFDVAVAGPLAGLVFAIPALLIGLQRSRIVVGPSSSDMLHTGVQVGSSFLLAILAKIALGADTIAGHQLMLHPLAFAGWLGLLVTALNLLPIGQLDGGHMAHALLGARRGHAVSVGALVTLFALALFVWPGLMIWAAIVWFIAGTRDVPALDDITPLNPGRRALGWFAFLLLAAIMIPVPHALYPSFGIHCPYL